jgi:hypothetical protein
MKKFNEFQYIRETAIVLAGVDEKTCTLSDYKHKIDEAMAIKEEMSNFFESEITEVELDFNLIEESEDIEDLHESEMLNEDLKTSKNPLARMFRWAATLRAKAKINGVFKQSFQATSQVTTNLIKLEVKRDEIGKVSGPESKVKMKEIDNMMDSVKQKLDMINQKKQEKLEDIKNPGFFGAGGVFGLNQDVLDRYITLMNTKEKLEISEMKVAQAQRILTDKEMKDLKDSIKQLKAREAKYQAESDNIEQAVKNAVEKADFTEADQEIKVEAVRIKDKIENIDNDLDALRDKIAAEDDVDKKKDFSKEYEIMVRDRSKAEKELDGLAKKAAKTVLGSSSKEAA